MFLNALPPDARQLLTQLGQQPPVRPFYLAGGSAAALHLSHRISADLDFFIHQDHYEAEPLTQHLQAIAHLEVQQQSRGTLVGRLGGVRVSFFVYPYPPLILLITSCGPWSTLLTPSRTRRRRCWSPLSGTRQNASLKPRSNS